MNITRGSSLSYGKAYYPRANSKPGLPIDPLNFKDYGVIAAADADGVSASQSVTVASTPLALINGALASSGVATFATPRNVVAAWTGTAVITITGTDEYGAILIESSASGTSLTGKKAFKTITSVSLSADVTGLTVGSGVVIGLPHRVDRGCLIMAKVDNATDAATFVPAVTTNPATATTGDVRGTVSFSSAPNDARAYTVLYKIASVASKVGAYGVDQYDG